MGTTTSKRKHLLVPEKALFLTPRVSKPLNNRLSFRLKSTSWSRSLSLRVRRKSS